MKNPCLSTVTYQCKKKNYLLRYNICNHTIKLYIVNKNNTFSYKLKKPSILDNNNVKWMTRFVMAFLHPKFFDKSFVKTNRTYKYLHILLANYY